MDAGQKPDRRRAHAARCATRRCSCIRAPPNTRASAASSSPTRSSSSVSTTTGALRVMDEVLTPDSSRFWPADTYRPARRRRASTSSTSATTSKPSTGTRQRPGPQLPAVVIERTRAKYVEALHRLDERTALMSGGIRVARDVRTPAEHGVRHPADRAPALAERARVPLRPAAARGSLRRATRTR